MENKIQIAINHLEVGNIHQPHIDMAIEALKKQMPKIATKTDYDMRSDSYGLLCPNCRANVGTVDNEDGDGVYKSTLYFDYCTECGQRLEKPKD